MRNFEKIRFRILQTFSLNFAFFAKINIAKEIEHVLEFRDRKKMRQFRKKLQKSFLTLIWFTKNANFLY